MPARNALKPYIQSGYYHLYNRGVDKERVFYNENDYAVFTGYLGEYLSPFVPPTEEEIKRSRYRYFRKNYHGKIELIAYVLMPNHFHFLLKQSEPRAIEGFMRSMLTRYGSYFNKRYDRVGHLFQDVYKGVLVEREDYFLWLSRYIHLNPREIQKVQKETPLQGDSLTSLAGYPYSSYPAYLGAGQVGWLKTGDVLSQVSNYREFVEGPAKGATEPRDLPTYALD